MGDRERVVEEELPPGERALPPVAPRRRSWVPWAVLVVVAVVIIAAVGAVQLGAFKRVSTPEVTGVSADTGSASVGQLVTFTATAKDPAGGALTYGWDFGDGTTATTADVEATHAYSIPGNYIVLLTVTTSSGGTATNDNSLVFVNVLAPAVLAPEVNPLKGGTPPAPVAVAAASNNVVNPGDTVKFTGNASWQYVWSGANASDPSGAWGLDTSIIKTYTWFFGDGSAPVSGNKSVAGYPAHTYTRIGNWFAKLKVESPSGSASYGITIRASRPTSGVRNPLIFNEATFGEPQFLDPASDYETAGGEVLLNVYETPVTYNGSSAADLIPLLATQVPSLTNGGISPAGTTYNFKIRAGVTFHNGDPLTADDVAFSWKRPVFINDPEGPAWMMDFAIFNYLVSNYLDQCAVKCLVSNYTSDMAAAGFPVPKWLSDNITIPGHPNVDEAVVTAALNAAIFVNKSAGTPAGTAGVVTVRLLRPYPAFLYISAFTIMDVVDMTYVLANGGDTFQTRNDFMVKHVMGTGPFKLRAWQPNQVIILDRNDQYWRTPAKLRQVNIIKVQDITTRELMLFSGQADIAAINRNHIYDVVDKATGNAKPGLLIDKDKPTFIVNFIGMNEKIKVANRAVIGDDFTNIPSTFFADIHIRRAFSYAYDYDTFINDVLFGGGERSYGPIPDGMFGFAKTNLFNFDVNKAKDELRAALVDSTTAAAMGCAGATNWLDCGFKIRIYYNVGNLNREQGSLLLKKSLEALNPGKIQISVVGLDWPVYLFTVSSKKKAVALFFLGWAPDYADPDDYASPFMHSPPSGYFTTRIGFSDPALDALIEKAAITVDPTARAALYAQIQKISYEDDVPYIWTHQSVTFAVLKDWVKGYVSNPMTTGNNEYVYYGISKG